MVTYVDFAGFTKYLNVTRGADAPEDALILAALEAAQTAINDDTGRTFTVPAPDAVATPRRYATQRSPLLFIGDCTSVTSVTVADTVWAAGDYQLEPLDNMSESGEYRPYSEIRARNWWPDSHGWANVTVVRIPGWAQIPGPVVEACKILGKDVYANRDVSFGIAGITEFAGVRVRENETVVKLLAPYNLRTGFG